VSQQKPNRFIPVNIEAFKYPLVNFARQLAGGGEVRIVAIGSSSTAGEGGIAPYPNRLQSHMTEKYGPRVVVFNRGIGGQEAPEELKRFQFDVIDLRPSLVIWQVGTNAVWVPDYKLADVAKAIAGGLEKLADEQSMDVVLMDLQYVTALLTPDTKDDTARMLSLIDTAAAAASPPVNVLHRFEMMRKWHEDEMRAMDAMIDPNDPDRLHQSDYSTVRVSYVLAKSIDDATRTS
jgi:hypothetical protein